MSEVQTVEVRFHGEKVAALTAEDGLYTLYRTPQDDYFVHYDQGEARAYLVTGMSATMPNGHLQEGISEKHARRMWPELLSAAGLD